MSSIKYNFLFLNEKKEYILISETQLKANLYCLYCENPKLEKSFKMNSTKTDSIQIIITHFDVDDIWFKIVCNNKLEEINFKNECIVRSKLLSLALNEFLEMFFKFIKDQIWNTKYYQKYIYIYY